MGPNGSGKSTLAKILAGDSGFEVTEGEVTYRGKNLLDMEPEVRAGEGIFLAFQYPVEIPGVSYRYFLRSALNAVRRHRGEEEIGAVQFLALIKEKAAIVELDEALLTRPVNDGFSGGEKKRSEILQLGLLDPTLAILDETDSGLDIDALKIVAKGINLHRREDRAIVLVTHYQRLLGYVVPDFVHVLSQGRIVKSGGKELALELEEKGYTMIEEAAGAPGS
jgi:Fe-S cluster assembly ATP-binding protein